MKFSIITINYNNVIGLKRTFESVFNQVYKDFEYIVIDNNSTDGSLDCIEYNNDKIDFWVSELDQGIYNAMNKGVMKAKGEYLLFLNSGDALCSTNSLTMVYESIINNNEIDIYYGNIFVVGDDIYEKIYPNSLSFKYFLNDTLPHPASFIKRKCFEEIMYDESLKIVSDWKLFVLGITKHNFTYQHINKTISTFYLDGISSLNKILCNQEKQSVLEKEFILFLDDYKIMDQLKANLFLSENSRKVILRNFIKRTFKL